MQNNHSLLLFVYFFLFEITTLNASEKMSLPALNLDAINQSSLSPVPTPAQLGHPRDRKRFNSKDSASGDKCTSEKLCILAAEPKNSTERKPSFIVDSQHSCFQIPIKKSVQTQHPSSRKSPDQQSTDY